MFKLDAIFFATVQLILAIVLFFKIALPDAVVAFFVIVLVISAFMDLFEI